MSYEVIFLARAPNEKVDTAKKLYLKGEKLIDIAKRLGIPEGTVRRWKKTYQWDNERSLFLTERSVKVPVKKKKNVAKEVQHVMENAELTEKQRLFCLFYIKCFNATKAYQKAYFKFQSDSINTIHGLFVPFDAEML